MKRGRVEELYVSVGQVIKSYDLVCRVSTDSLTHHSDSVVSHLQVEIIEEGVCNAILAKVGDTLEVGAPLLVLVDDHADGRSVDYNKLSSYQRALWQGYVMDKHDEGACGC
jgi:pyruvate/2-oxoglutarate dehydrogenase complex dihydrolipoamide acyltransferase (E2) component